MVEFKFQWYSFLCLLIFAIGFLFLPFNKKLKEHKRFGLVYFTALFLIVFSYVMWESFDRYKIISSLVQNSIKLDSGVLQSFSEYNTGYSFILNDAYYKVLKHDEYAVPEEKIDTLRKGDSIRIKYIEIIKGSYSPEKVILEVDLLL